MVLYNVENISKKPKMPKNYKISNVWKEGQISSKCLISFAECLILCHNIRICSKILVPSNFANLYPPLLEAMKCCQDIIQKMKATSKAEREEKQFSKTLAGVSGTRFIWKVVEVGKSGKKKG